MVLERQLWVAVMRAQHDLGVDVPVEVIDDYVAVIDKVDLDEHRGARAGDPPRREGPDRGVLGAGRPRADPRRHDVAGPHRERRAAAGARRAGARPRPDGGRAGPAGRAGRRARHPRDDRPQPQRARPRPPRWASGSPTPARSCCRPSDRVEELLARYPLRGIKGPVGTQQDMLDLLGGAAETSTRSRRRSPRHLGFDADAHQRRSGVPALARPRRGRRAGAGGRRARPAWPPPSGSWPGLELATEGFQPGPGRARRPCPTR